MMYTRVEYLGSGNIYIAEHNRDEDIHRYIKYITIKAPGKLTRLNEWHRTCTCDIESGLYCNIIILTKEEAFLELL